MAQLAHDVGGEKAVCFYAIVVTLSWSVLVVCRSGFNGDV